MILGQQRGVDAFLVAWHSRRLHHSWLLAGPRGVGKASFAREAALSRSWRPWQARARLERAMGSVDAADAVSPPPFARAIARMSATLGRSPVFAAGFAAGLAGALGAAILQQIIDRGWAKRDRDSRLVTFRPSGERALKQALDGAH